MTQDVQQPETQNVEKSKPVETLRDGRLNPAIWRNQGGEHGPIYNVTLSYSYQDKEGNWRDTQSIPGHELLKTANLAQNAYASVARLKDQDRAVYIEQQRDAAQSAPSRDHAPER